MLKNYSVSILNGSSKEVYALIAPFAMDRKVIREMDGYPILTDNYTIWFIAFQSGKVVGFSAVIHKGEVAVFTYAYIIPEQRNRGLYQTLLTDRIKWAKRNGIDVIKADCTKESLPAFKKAGFTTVKEYQKWTKVEKQL